MVVIRDHNAHHDDPSALPLLTESARVAEVTALDADRTEAVRDTAARILGDVGHDDLVEGGDSQTIDWDGVGSFLATGDGPLHEKLSHLRDRYEREYPSLLSIRLHEVETPVDFVPGQYVTLEFHRTPAPTPSPARRTGSTSSSSSAGFPADDSPRTSSRPSRRATRSASAGRTATS